MEYNFKEIEQKWQAAWAADKTYHVTEDNSRPKYSTDSNALNAGESCWESKASIRCSGLMSSEWSCMAMPGHRFSNALNSCEKFILFIECFRCFVGINKVQLLCQKIHRCLNKS